MDVSIIIINYNTKELTLNCINSIKKFTSGISYEIILVDNASTDGSKEYFESCKDIEYYYLDNNLGFGRANNYGFKYAKGDYIFLLNSDTILINNAVKIFHEFALSHNNWGCLGAQLFTKELGESPSFGYYLTFKRELKAALLSYVRLFTKSEIIVSKKSSFPYQVEMVIGADLFIKTTTVLKHGLFDDKYFMYHEENDMQLTYSKAGLSHYIVPGPQIIHLESQSTSIPFNKKIMSTRSLFIYLKKWNNRTLYILFRFLYFFLKLPLIFHKDLCFNQKLMYLKLLME